MSDLLWRRLGAACGILCVVLATSIVLLGRDGLPTGGVLVSLWHAAALRSRIRADSRRRRL